jgi:hypothetical protein
MSDWNLDFIADRLQEAALNPAEWPLVLGDIGRTVGGAGAVLFSVGSRFLGPLSSPELEEMTADHIKGESKGRAI